MNRNKDFKNNWKEARIQKEKHGMLISREETMLF